jgi:hypothetical protein
VQGARKLQVHEEREKMKAIVPMEVVEVVDDVDESEDKGELRKKGSINLAHALSSVIQLIPRYSSWRKFDCRSS